MVNGDSKQTMGVSLSWVIVCTCCVCSNAICIITEFGCLLIET